MGLIVAIEGGDAAGKHTHSTLLAGRLGATRLAFPAYEQPAGKAILGHLKREWACRFKETAPGTAVYPSVERERHEQLNALVFQALHVVSRLEMLPVINACRATGRNLIFDRYTASGIVYGTLDGLDPAWVELVNASTPQPDLWILLDVPVEEGFRRRPERRDRYEVDRAYLEKVRQGYLELFEKKAAERKRSVVEKRESIGALASVPSWVIVNGLGTVEEVQARIWSVVEPLVRW